jgi:N-glycosylase/DNA lyase
MSRVESAPDAIIAAPDFNLALTLNSGQVFHWTEIDGWWEGLIGSRFCAVHECDAGLEFRGDVTASDVTRYFSLDHPMEQIRASFPSDPFSQAALDACSGLRIIRQPEWECLATFITSSMKQVAHIRQMSLAIRARYGASVDGSKINTYPEPEILSKLAESDLRDCGLGFRAKSLLGAARMIAHGEIDLKALRTIKTSVAREALCSVPGVGVKVANCVLLFGYERLDAVPVDVWIDRILRAMRGNRPASPAQLQKYSERRLGPYAGYVQQYLFHHARVSKTLPQR